MFQQGLDGHVSDLRDQLTRIRDLALLGTEADALAGTEAKADVE
jgi:hypothetical protein